MAEALDCRFGGKDGGAWSCFVCSFGCSRFVCPFVISFSLALVLGPKVPQPVVFSLPWQIMLCLHWNFLTASLVALP